MARFQFIAEYSGDRVYMQTPEDRSIQDATRNAFYDVQYKPLFPLEELERFAIFRRVGEGKLEHAIVNVRTGEVTICGQAVAPPRQDGPFTLYFSRQHFEVPGVFHKIDCRIGWTSNFGESAIFNIEESNERYTN